MGHGTFNSSDYVAYSHATKKHLKHSADELFEARKINEALDPKGVKIRESCDSEDHPESNAIILALDVTGSMGMVAAHIAKTGLPALMKEIYDRKPVPDPHIMFMGFDDLAVGGHFQVSQFESDIRIAKQLDMLWMENNGGGNNYESYSMPWLFAANNTKIDCFEKRGKKGYLFTVGDELPTPKLGRDEVKRCLGHVPEGELTGEALLKRAQKMYNVYHLMADEGSWARSNKNELHNAWTDLMGDNAIHLPDHTKIAEVIVSTIQIAEGADKDTVIASWEDKKIKNIVATALKNVKRIVEI